MQTEIVPADGAVRAQSATVAKLIGAAAREFNRHGFSGTDTNKIARLAGFAPQTFYRWFKDKTEIFIAVYRSWEEEERALLARLMAQKAPAHRLVEAIVGHHRTYRIFRRSLRQLSLEDPVVRRARAESRTRQIERVRASLGATAPDLSELAATLFQIERLCDAIAEDEFEDLRLSDRAARAVVASLLNRIRR
jgi:AcrR family transcriptional regulator